MKTVLRLFGQLGLGLVLVLTLVLAVMIWRAMTFASGAPQAAALTLPGPVPFDQARAADRLGQAIRFRTVSVGLGQPRETDQWLGLHAWLAASYPLTHAAMGRETFAGGLTLLYTWEGTDPALAPIILMAHQDVVPVNPGTLEDWTHPAFDGVVADGIVWGRGALDDKGALVGLMEAAEALLASGFAPERTVYFLFGHDEEIGGSGVRAAVSALKARGVRPMFVLDEGSAVLESLPMTGKRAGLIGVAEKGYLSIELVAEAVGGHSSMPPRESGAVRIARAVLALEDNQLPGSIMDPPTGDMMRAVGADMPFLTRFALANTWALGGLVDAQMAAVPAANALSRTTTAPTMLDGSIKDNVLPQRASAVVNFRIHPRDTIASVTDHVTRLVAPFGVSVQVIEGAGEASPVAPTTSRGYQVLASLAAEIGEGAPVTTMLVLGATDARHMAPLTANAYRFMPILMSPEELTGFHGTDERLTIANVGRLVSGYSRLIMAMAGPDSGPDSESDSEPDSGFGSE
jgi:carboxypeptidase PM20D1